MRRTSRTTTLALAGLLALGGVAGCADGEEDTGVVEQEGEGNLEGDPQGEQDVEEEVEPQVEGEGEGEGG
ncbi:MAG: hypothetical protein KY442_05225 [Proteobacteria bacterium]|nr:hypothetical protein [Pseudomonadota bacterium]